MEAHQRRILGRIADGIEGYRLGRISMLTLLNNAWGLYTAAELGDPSERDLFMRLYYAVSKEYDALQPWMPAGLGSEEKLKAALTEFEHWTSDLRGDHTDA